MEALAALGLACNIFQAVSFGRETIQVAKEVYHSGRLDPHLTNGADSLDKVISELQASLQPTTATTKPTPSQEQLSKLDRQLIELANKCQGAGRDLCEEVSFPNGHGTKDSLVATVKTATKANWRKRRLETLERKLGDAERRMQTGLLAKIYERTSLSDSDLAKINSNLRSFVLEYRKGNADVSSLVKIESTETRQHVSAESKRNQKAVKEEVRRSEAAICGHITNSSHITADKIIHSIGELEVTSQQRAHREALQERLIQSLRFANINERRNQVSKSHPRTFRWVLQDEAKAETEHLDDSDDQSSNPSSVGTGDDNASADVASDTESASSEQSDGSEGNDHANRTWDSFPDWLRQSADIHTYWISGKPGSGKTTLMKYIISNPRTQTYLNLWSPGAVMISHFFWRPGTSMQQSIKGLLCSLLYQLLLHDVSATDIIIKQGSDISQKSSDTDWPMAELKSTLQPVLGQITHDLCVFLDGLDEVLPSDGMLALLETIEWIRNSAGRGRHIKFCLGSRAEPLLEARLCFHPCIRLQDLNQQDLLRYARAQVKIPEAYAALQVTSRKMTKPELKAEIIGRLVIMAEGVFLWLCLTVYAVNKAIQQAEPYEDLQHRIKHLPRDLETLYADMWARMNDESHVFKARAARYIRLLIERQDYKMFPRTNKAPSVLHTMLAMDPSVSQALLNFDLCEESSAVSLLRKCEATVRDIKLRCAGCVTAARHNPDAVFEYITPWHGDEFEPLVPYISSFFNFIHRTVFDFLVNSDVGRDLLQYDRLTREEMVVRLAESELAAIYLFRFNLRSSIIAGVKSVEGDSFTEIRSTFSTLFERLCPLVARVKPAERHRLFLLSEKLFNSGYMVLDSADDRGKSVVKIARNRYRSWVCTKSRDRQQHLFLTSLSAHYHRSSSHFLLDAVQTRELSQETKLSIVTRACQYPHLFMILAETFLKIAQYLVEGGTDVNMKAEIHPVTRLSGVSAVYFNHKTPLQELLWHMWQTVMDCTKAEENKPLHNWAYVLQLLKLMLDHGASLGDEMYVLLEIGSNDCTVRQISRIVLCALPSAEEDDEEVRPLALVVYPAASILQAILRRFAMLKLEWDSLPGELNSLLVRFRRSRGPYHSEGRAIAVGVCQRHESNRAPWNDIFLGRVGVYTLESNPIESLPEFQPFIAASINISPWEKTWRKLAQKAEILQRAGRAINEEVRKRIQNGHQKPEPLVDYLTRIGVTRKYVPPDEDEASNNDTTPAVTIQLETSTATAEDAHPES